MKHVCVSVTPAWPTEYAEDVTSWQQKHKLLHHLFIDDIHCQPDDVPRTVSTLSDCFVDVIDWGIETPAVKRQ
jgi:hypothetical protein